MLRSALALILLVLGIASLASGLITEQHRRMKWSATPFLSAQTRVIIRCSEGYFALDIKRTVPTPVVQADVRRKFLGFSYIHLAIPSMVVPVSGGGGTTGTLVDVVGVHYWFPTLLLFVYPVVVLVRRLSAHYRRLGSEELQLSDGRASGSMATVQEDPQRQLAISRHELRISLARRLGMCVLLAALLTALLAAVPHFPEPQVLGAHPALPVEVALKRVELGWPDDMASYSELICIASDGRQTPLDMGTIPLTIDPIIRQKLLGFVGWKVDVPDVVVAYLLCFGLFALGATHGPLTRYWRTVGRILATLCPACRYPLVGLQASRCPECGQQIG